MSKFKTINGTLCRMVEPTPLTPEATFPCVVTRREDGDIGRYTKRHCSGLIGEQLVVKEIIDGKVVFEDAIWTLCELPYLYFEIIGYPVEEGSKEWAWYQMEQNHKVFLHNDSMPDGYWSMTSDNEKKYAKNSRMGWELDYEEFTLNLSYNVTGWQLYKEPEQPKYKVGDWVDCKDLVGVHAQCKVLEIHKHNVILGCKTGHRWSLPHNNIIHKLSPAEVIVKIGCLSGTVRPVSTNGIHIWLHLIGVDDKIIATIRISSLDKETRKLVESLLEAMQEEKK